MKTNVVDLVREITRLAELDQDAVRRVGEHLHKALQLALDRQALLTRTPISPAPMPATMPATMPEFADGSTPPIAAESEADMAKGEARVLVDIGTRAAKAWRLLRGASSLLENDACVLDATAALLLLDDAATLVYGVAEALGAEELPS